MSDDRGSRTGARARYIHRVTRDDVGERVSLRHHDPTDPDPRPSDRVGRLIGHDGEVLLLVDRHGQLHQIPDATVVASRVVPPHPRRPPEPMVGTQASPLERQAARVLLLDGQDRVLLIAHLPEPGVRVWTAPGGGLRPGENHLAAARRELTEELGLDVEVGPWIWTRREVFRFRDVWLDQAERWYLARVEQWEPDEAPLDDPNIDQARWFTLDDLRDDQVQLAPRALADHIVAVLRDGPPAEPKQIGR